MLATIDAGRAARAREIYNAALTLAPQDEAEWAALEAERLTHSGWYEGPKVENKPHAQSAYAHLPMRGIAQGNFVLNRDGYHKYGEVTQHVQHTRAIALWPEPKRAKFRSPVSGKVVKDAKVEVKVSAPHPRSACKELPLSGIGLDRTPGGYDLFTGEMFETARFGRKCQATHKWTLSAAEKKALAGRPLRYVEAK